MTEQDSEVDAAENRASPRRGLRFSLLNLALLLTIAALGVGLYQAGQEVVPLRESVRRLREELGYFHVDDESRIHVKQSSTKLPNAWKWRVFLPPANVFRVRYFCGPAPDPESMDREAWFELLRKQGFHDGGELQLGEFGFEALLTEFDGQWFWRWGRVQDDGTTLALPETAAWLDDETAWAVSSDSSMERARTFKADEPVILLHVEPDHRGSPAQSAREMGGDGAGQRILIWIEADPGPTPGSTP